jgi:hypothetical protein
MEDAIEFRIVFGFAGFDDSVVNGLVVDEEICISEEPFPQLREAHDAE